MSTASAVVVRVPQTWERWETAIYFCNNISVTTSDLGKGGKLSL